MTQYATPPPAFFADDAPQEAVVRRIPERLFIGAAAVASGAWRMDRQGEGSYLNGWPPQGPGYYLERAAQLFVQSPCGGIAGSFTARTSDRGDIYSGTTIGSASTVVVDTQEPGWASYHEAQRDPGGGTAFAQEVATKNKGGSVINTPYTRFPGGATIGIWLAGGGDPRTGAPANPSTAAIVIGRNGSTWHKGIVFDAAGLTDGAALALAQGHRLEWHGPSGPATNTILSTGDGTRHSGIQLRNGEVLFTAGGGIAMNLCTVGNGVTNWLTITGQTAAPVVLSANGPTSDIDLRLAPKGAGLVWLGRYQGGGGQVLAGSITVRDSAGVARRLAVLA